MQDPDALVATIYDAPLQPEGWATALLALSQAVGCNTAQLVLWDRVSRLPLYDEVSRQELRELEDQYLEHFVAIDPHTKHIRRAANGAWLNFAALFDEGYVQHSEIYQQYLLPQGLRWSLGVRLEVSDASEMVLSVLRGPHQQPFGSIELALLKRINPHLQRAARIHERLMQTGTQAAVEASILHRLPWPLFVVDVQGRLFFSNQAGEALLRARGPWMLSHGRLGLTKPQDWNLLSGLLAAAVERRHGGAMALCDDQGNDWHLVVHPLAAQLGVSNPWQRPLALVWASPRQGTPHLDPALLKMLFGFTAAETRLAQALLEGHTPETCAQAMQLSISTVRSQLSALFSKSGTSRQSELIRLLATLPGLGQAGS